MEKEKNENESIEDLIKTRVLLYSTMSNFLSEKPEKQIQNILINFMTK